MKFNGLMAKIAGMTVLPLAAIAILGQAASADTLVTQDFQVNVESRCAEGNVTCNNVQYFGINRHTGATLRLTGRTVNALCADGVTPCQFLGYQFRNGVFTYTITEEGQLIIRRGGRVLLDQTGTWFRQ